MKKTAMMTSFLGAMAIAPKLMDDTKKMRKNAMKAGRKSSKMVMNKIDGRRSKTSLIATGLGGYLLAHAAPIRTLIRDK